MRNTKRFKEVNQEDEDCWKIVKKFIKNCKSVSLQELVEKQKSDRCQSFPKTSEC